VKAAQESSEPIGVSVATLTLRVFLAICVFPHGAQKLLGWFGGPGFSGMLEGFHARLGIPTSITTLVIIGEFFGSIALAMGLFTRFVGGSFIVIMLGAIFLGGPARNGFFMNYWCRQEGEGYEYNLLIIGVSLSLVILGSGKFSLQRMINKSRKTFPAIKRWH